MKLTSVSSRSLNFSCFKHDPENLKIYTKSISIFPGIESLSREIGLLVYLPLFNFFMLFSNEKLDPQYQQEINDCNRTIELNPQHTEAYNSRGSAYGKLGNHKQAIKDYNRAIELNPQLAMAYFSRGLIYTNLGNYQLAIKDCNKAIELNPLDAHAYWLRGLVYDALGNQQQAISNMKIAAKMGSTMAQDYLRKNKIEW